MAATKRTKRGAKVRSRRKPAGVGGGKTAKTARKKTTRPRRPKALAPQAKPSSRTMKARLPHAGVDTIELEFTWGGGVEATLMTLLDHERERLSYRPRDRQRITHEHPCEFGGVHPIQWDLWGEGDMKSPILRGRKNNEPLRTLAQGADGSRWPGRIYL